MVTAFNSLYMIEVHEILDNCSVRIDPERAQFELPAELPLSLDADGIITLGPHVIRRPPHGSKEEYEKIKGAFETGHYTLKISPSGITLEIHDPQDETETTSDAQPEDDRVTSETRRSLARLRFGGFIR